MELTPLETEVLNNLFDSAEGNGHDFGYTEDHGIDPKQAGGVISSLVKKNIIMVHEPVTTDSGTWHQFTWVGREPHEVNSIGDILNQSPANTNNMKQTVSVRIDVPAFAQVEVEARTPHEAIRMVEDQLNEHGIAAPVFDGVRFDVDWSGYDMSNYVVTESYSPHNPDQLELQLPKGGEQ